jgi:hypothetical protein
MRRLALLALAATGALGLTGCHEVLRVFLNEGDPDPPVHQPPPPAKRAVPAATGAAAKGRAFSGRAVGQLTGRITLRHGFVKSTIKNARFVGDFTGKPRGGPQAGDEGLGPLRSAHWYGRFDVVRDRRNGKTRMKGLVLADFTDASEGRACLRIGYKTRKGKQGRAPKKGSATLAILGGEGGAQTLAGSATILVRIVRGHQLAVRGRVVAKQGPARGFPGACTKLEKQFGLTPLARR